MKHNLSDGRPTLPRGGRRRARHFLERRGRLRPQLRHEPREGPFLLLQKPVGTVELQAAPAVQYRDAVVVDNGAQAVRHRQDRAVAEVAPDRLLDLAVRLGVDGWVFWLGVGVGVVSRLV